MALIDLHSHVLPALDDGPNALAGALDLVAEAADGDVGVLVATPHLRHDFPGVDVHAIAARCRELQAEIERAGIPVTLVPGGEVDVLWAYEASDEDLRAASYGGRGRDLLVETPYGELTSTFEDLLFHLSARGYRLLLAHPERNPTFQRDPQRLRALVARGVLVQVTANSLTTTRPRSRSRALASALVAEGLCHVVASDAHGAHVARAGLAEGVAAAAAIDPARARWMATAAPAAILHGAPLPPVPQRAAVRPTGLRRLLGSLS